MEPKYPVIVPASDEPEENDESKASIVDAIAEHFGIDTDKVYGYVLVAEHELNGNVACSTVYSSMTPRWRLSGYADALRRQLNQLWKQEEDEQ